MAETLTVQMDKILDEYSHRVQNVTNVAINRVSRECVKRLRNTSPRKTGDYAAGWGTKKMASHGKIANIIVHNKTEYSLTHLLENGHLIVNAKGTFGRTAPRKHIKPVEEWANNELPLEIERELQ